MKITGKKNFTNTLLKKILILISLIALNSVSPLKLSNQNLNLNYANEMNFLNLQKALLSSDQIQVQNVIKKQPKLITHGLIFDQGTIYESGAIVTNQNQIQNFLIKKNYQTNQILKSIPLGNLNGRGIAKCKNFIFQLTANEKKILKYTYPNLDILAPLTIDSDMSEGAEGLAALTNEVLVATDGSNNLHILDCENDLGVIKTIPVFDSSENPMNGLEDLVVVGEFVYANRRNDNRVLKIDPKTGVVVKFYDMINLINFELKMKSLTQDDIARGNVLNGISFDEARRFFVLTGKNWGFYYEVDLK